MAQNINVCCENGNNLNISRNGSFDSQSAHLIHNRPTFLQVAHAYEKAEALAFPHNFMMIKLKLCRPLPATLMHSVSALIRARGFL